MRETEIVVFFDLGLGSRNNVPSFIGIRRSNGAATCGSLCVVVVVMRNTGVLTASDIWYFYLVVGAAGRRGQDSSAWPSLVTTRPHSNSSSDCFGFAELQLAEPVCYSGNGIAKYSGRLEACLLVHCFFFVWTGSEARKFISISFRELYRFQSDVICNLD